MGFRFVYAAEFLLVSTNDRPGRSWGDFLLKPGGDYTTWGGTLSILPNRLTKVRESRMTSLMSSGRVKLTEGERSEAKFFGNFELAVDPILGVFSGGAEGVIRSTNCANAPCLITVMAYINNTSIRCMVLRDTGSWFGLALLFYAKVAIDPGSVLF